MTTPATLICPRCMSSCKPTVSGWSRCIWCRWAGPVTETAEATAGGTPGSVITNITVTPTTPEDQAAGLLAYVGVELVGGVRLDGFTARRTRDGRFALSYPVRRDRRGREHPYVRLAPELRDELERRVLAELGGSREMRQ